MPRFNQPPIPRSEALQPLSRDHYQSLVQSQHLIKAADADAVQRRKVLSEFVDAWTQTIAEHFVDEERLLLEHLAEGDRERLLAEHAALRELAEQALQQRRHVDPDADVLRQLGQRLHDHIRWEEREMFTHLEQRLSDQQLADLGQQTEAIEASRRPHGT
ncbi:MAG: hemerythrin domain-containing protein [Phycisphaeraceae bacterium]